jgi:hypothetical protein
VTEGLWFTKSNRIVCSQLSFTYLTAGVVAPNTACNFTSLDLLQLFCLSVLRIMPVQGASSRCLNITLLYVKATQHFMTTFCLFACLYSKAGRLFKDPAVDVSILHC